MTKTLTAASCVSRQRTQFLWISDALLADTFNSFCHHKRYGSNVPGPLEAQRRAAKRKNTSLAHVNSGGISADPSIVLGSSANKLAWWNFPKDTESESGRRRVEDMDCGVMLTPKSAASARVLPTWLSVFQSSGSNTDAEPVKIEVEQTQLNPQEISDHQAESLSRCRSVVEVKQWVEKEGFNLREDTYVGEAILHYILRRHQTNLVVEDVAEYICDPTFHPPGTSFISLLLHRIVRRSWDATDWKVLRQAVCSAIELGLLSVYDLKKTLGKVTSVQKFRLRNIYGPIKDGRARGKLFMACGILESLDRSTILQLTNLGSPMLSKLFTKFTTHAHLDWCQKMLWRLLPWASKRHVSLIRRLNLRSLQYHSKLHNSAERTGQAIAERLARADPDVLQLVLVSMTEKLVTFSRTSDTMLYRFLWHHWCGALAVLGLPPFNASLTKRGWDSLQSVHTVLQPDHRLLTFLWTALCLGQGSRTSVSLSDRLRFIDGFEQLLGSLPNMGDNFSDAAISGFGNLALPKKDVLFRHLIRPHTSNAEETVKPAIAKGITSSILDKHIQNTHLEHSGVLGQMLQKSTINPHAFKILSRKMIRKSTVYFGLLCHLLENNTELKIALQMPQKAFQPEAVSQKKLLRTSKASYVDLSTPIDVKRTTRYADLSVSVEVERRTTSPSAPSNTDSSSLTREEVIDLLNHLAISFATSPVATPRAALRRVYWCYLFLCRYGAPVQPAITRALWHAGVTRYGDQGTAATLLKWILWRVREVEGEGVAKQLLWNASWRQSRADLIDAWSIISEEEERAVLALLEGQDSSPTSESETSLPDAATELSPGDVNSFLTGDKEVDREILKKIQFLQSEPADKPFWLPQEKTRHPRKTWKKKGKGNNAAVG